jgi:rare lipoprotein A
LRAEALLIAGALLVGALAIGTPVLASERGTASWYQSGARTASGERFLPEGMTCARRRGHWGSMLRVTDLATGKSIICRVNDRGPSLWTGRIIDLSRGSARHLGIIDRGIARVSIDVIKE